MSPKENNKESESKSVELVREIKAAILKGEFQPGQRLVESKLCKLYNTNRYRVRNAIHELEHEGFVIITPNVGATVASLSRRMMENTFEIASVLDGLAVRLATPFLTKSDIDKLEGLVIGMENAQKVSACARYNDEFHIHFTERSENPQLIQLMDLMRTRINSFGHYTFAIPGQIEESRKWHREIFAAVQDRKAHLAERKMRDHIIDSMNRLLIYLQKNDV